MKEGENILEMSGDVLETESGPRVDVRARESALGAIDGVGLLLQSENSEHYPTIPCGLTVRIPGFHPGGPGSIPGMGRSHFDKTVKIKCPCK